MREKTIGLKELHRNLSKIAKEAFRGASFVVLNHTTTMFRIEPPTPPQKKYSWADLKNLQFKGGDKNLSRDIDKIVYGL
ncbi:MAG: hypothetical protein EXS55_00485 [Candidatus Magasanikbacteria bacterium]|nr:hypothetical protein [Candidatus Magasanikbacteria bacterium]